MHLASVSCYRVRMVPSFADAVSQATSISGVLLLLYRSRVGTNYAWVREEVRRLGLDTSHWRVSSPPRKIDLQNMHTFGRQSVKRLVLREGLLPHSCAVCGTGPVWRGAPLALRLDHINGQSWDHRLDNLRFLCPNCDSQTDTFCGRNKKGSGVEGEGVPRQHRSNMPKHRCACGAPTYKNGSRCRTCAAAVAVHPTKIVWPTKEELAIRLKTMSFSALARELGVSDNAIRKHL